MLPSAEKNDDSGALTQLQLRPPAHQDQWDRYYDLRWRVLRAPWNQPRGSERDDLEADSSHLAVWSEADSPVAVGRIHLNSATEAQVRYMAVEPSFARSGFGSRILNGLEARARELGAARVVLSSREVARCFYERHGYAVVGPAATMFGVVAHVRMEKSLQRTD